MRWLGVDVGEAYVGLAVCDPDERVAVPLEVVPASAAFPAIRRRVERDGVEGVVFGLPLLGSGDEGEAARMARRLGERVRRVLGVPVEYEDERLTSAEAERLAGTQARTDDIAAVLILDQFMQRRRRERETGRREHS